MSAPAFYVDEAQPHLGGYIVGGDAATHYPELYEWLVHDYGVRSVLDIGCGEGYAVRYFSRMECEALGVDGVPQEDERIVQHDYTTGPWPLEDASPPWPGANDWDLVWSCEFVEHVGEQFVPNFLPSFRLGRLVLMTHAEPDQPGHHHVNCQPASYWRGVMAAIGYSFDEALTVYTRQLARLNEDPNNHFARSGLAFRRGLLAG